MKILSLFDGMACGALAMQAAGIEIDKYIAYEVDKYAIKTAQHNFQFIEERGDVFKADFTEYAGFDYLIGGSPCTYWSIAQTKNRETVASGMGWELFGQYVRALHEAKPRFFLYENNKSMSVAIRASITETFGFEPILINSALVSAQNRQRLYWCGIRQADGTYKKADIQQPADRGILLKDILETNGTTWLEKSHTIDATYYKGGSLNGEKPHQNSTRLMAAEPVGTTEQGKAFVLTANYANGSDNVGDYVTHTLEKHVKSCVAVAVNPLEKANPRMDIAEPICVNSKSGRAGAEGLQPSLQDRVYDTAGKMPAVISSFNPKIAEPLKIREATKAGYTEIQAGNCVDMAQPNSKTRRGRNMGNKSNCLQTTNEFYQYCGSIDAPIYEVKDGFITVKGNKYPIKLVDGFYIIRKLTVRECMRLQTVPEWYEWPVSKSQAYKMLGNGWTVEVIAHLLRGLK